MGDSDTSIRSNEAEIQPNLGFFYVWKYPMKDGKSVSAVKRLRSGKDLSLHFAIIYG